MLTPAHLLVKPNRSWDKLEVPELIAERQYWNTKIESATGWGAALAAASDFRDACDAELLRRFS